MTFCRHIALILCLCRCLFPATPVHAKNLGSIGTTYPVVERNVIDELKSRIDQERLAKIMEEYKHYKPVDLHFLPAVQADRSFQVDMTYTLDHDIQDENGRILYPKGLTWNPLDYVSFPGGLVIINGEDARQLQWFAASEYAKNRQARLLVTSGNAMALIKQLHRPVFYLNKVIATRLQLTAVPSVVVQEGKMIRVREVKVEDQ